MRYRDLVYGQQDINDPLAIELIKSPSLQRLRMVNQAGFRPLWVNPEVKAKDIESSRFSHSVGVYLLLKKFNASFEEQISGLVHDVSHTTFSHCIDYAINNGSGKKQDYQDNIFQSYIFKSEIPSILMKYNLDPKLILEDINFPLKEKKLPDLCADRIDYSLRDGLVHEVLTIKEVKYFLENLAIDNCRWVFKNLKSAEKFTEFFRQFNNSHYCGFPSAVMFRAVGDYLKHSIEKGYIVESDFFTSDNEIIKKINKHMSDDDRLSVLWGRMNKKIKAINDSDNFEASVLCKSRIVDPFCLHEGKIVRVSDVKLDWKEIIKKELLSKQYFIRFEK